MVNQEPDSTGGGNSRNAESPAPKIRETHSALVLAPLEGKPTLFNVADALLKSPGRVIHEIRNPRTSGLPWILLSISLVGMAFLGIINGLFTGGSQIYYATLKFPAGLLASAVICWPSLYVFSAITGADITVRESAGILGAFVAIGSIFLVGFAPVLWLFSQSTHSVVFMGFLNVCFWLVATCLGIRFVRGTLEILAGKKQGAVVVWYFIFLLVSLQMTTTLRPVIGASDQVLPTERKFFVNYWFEVMDDKREKKATTP